MRTSTSRNSHRADPEITFRDVGQIMMEKASETVENTMSSMKQQSTNIQKDVGNYVKQNPLKSLGWATLTGLVIGFLLRK